MQKLSLLFHHNFLLKKDLCMKLSAKSSQYMLGFDCSSSCSLLFYYVWSCQNVCDTLSFLLDNIYIRFGTKLYRQIAGIPKGTNCGPLVADLFLFCYEKGFHERSF